jgi:hypothetical protein
VLHTELGAAAVDGCDLDVVLPALQPGNGAALSPELVEAMLAGATTARLNSAALGLDGGSVPVELLRADALPARFGFVARPRP